MTILYCDLETFSPVPITAGTHRYAEEAEVMLWPYALDDEEPKVWDCTCEPMPDDLKAALDDESVLTVWHNGGMFDLIVLIHAMGIDLPISRVHDTLVQALQHSLPGSLGDLCDVLKVDTDKAKDKRGKRLIQMFCKPAPKNSKVRRFTRETHPAEWEEFKEYARADITSMREVYRKMPKWNLIPFERALWELDQKINRRGMPIDVELAEAALRAIDREQARLARETKAQTNGEVQAATQRDKLLQFILTEYGIDFPDLKGATVEKFLERADVDDGLRDLLVTRLQASTSSTTKYKALLRAVSSDGRLRGTKQFCGASRTGRWAGRLFQPDNLPRPSHSRAEIEEGIEHLKLDCADLLHENVMDLTKSIIRGAICAPAGKKFVIADLSNIEGRCLAWLAGEEWKLDAFREFDHVLGEDGEWYSPEKIRHAALRREYIPLALDAKGEMIHRGPDLYKLAYAKSFGVDPATVDKTQRQIGKVQELALGYAGGISAFMTFAEVYGIDLDEMAEQAWPNLPAETVAEAEDFLEWLASKPGSRKFPMSHRAAVTCEVFKRLWRQAHPAVVAWWRDVEDLCRLAIQRPGTTYRGKNFIARRDGAWLRIKMPSGRCLCYPSPQVDDEGGISFMGVNQYNRKWERIRTYGGKLVENLTQAFARDVLSSSMIPAEEAGYEIILTVHDEIVTEAPDSPEFNPEHLSAIMATVPAYAPGLPLAAAGFEAMRYGKE